MFWDNVSGLYDLFETIYNGKVYRGLGRKVAEEIAPDDVVLECACGTGAISSYIAPKCRKLVATDFSVGMLRQTAKNCRAYDNVKIRRADMTHLKCRDNRFDKVVAGNVIHLLDNPRAALKELVRVCKPGGKIIVPGVEDTIELNVPECTASGTKFCIRGKGVKTVNGTGNLYVTVEIDIPAKLSREQLRRLNDFESSVQLKSCDNMQKYANNISAVYGKHIDKQ